MLTLLDELRELLSKKRISHKQKKIYIEKIDNFKLTSQLNTPKLIIENKSQSEHKSKNEQYFDNLTRVKVLLKQANNICEQLNIGDIYSYSKVKEVLMAEKLKHKVAKEYSGADAYDGINPVEYKSTISRTIKATYNGISVQPSWEEQVEYLRTTKIGKYKHHYFAKFKGIDITELYRLDCDTILEYMIPRLKTQFHKKNKGKDPRLGITLGSNFIKKNSIQII